MPLMLSLFWVERIPFLQNKVITSNPRRFALGGFNFKEGEKMKIIETDINLLKPYPKNAKNHPPTQIDNVAESIRQFGFQQPIVVDKNYEIIIGHCRYMAAMQLLLETVPVVIADNLTDEQVKKLRLIDNKTNESDWDFDFLSEEVNELDFDGFNIDWGMIQEEDYGTEFDLPSGDKSNFVTMSFVLSNEQAELIKEAMEEVQDEIEETYGNENKNGNRLFEVVRQWKALKI